MDFHQICLDINVASTIAKQKMNFTMVLLDSGKNGIFVDKDWIKFHKIPTIKFS